jgi:predicted DNA-binding transcriptional regulator AlpA
VEETEILRVPQAAALLRRGEWWVRDACKKGLLPHTRIGTILEFDRAELEAWVAAQHVTVEDALARAGRA